jgi:hypothetical protein
MILPLATCLVLSERAAGTGTDRVVRPQRESLQRVASEAH